MNKEKKLIFQINKLMQLNMDRVLGYEQASCLVSSKELAAIFKECIQQSEHYSEKLKTSMIFHGVKLSSRPSLFGKFFRWWMGLQVLFGKDRNISVLKSCLVAEKMLEKSYRFACENQFIQYYYPFLKNTFTQQQFILRRTRDTIEAALDVSYLGRQGDIPGQNSTLPLRFKYDK